VIVLPNDVRFAGVDDEPEGATVVTEGAGKVAGAAAESELEGRDVQGTLCAPFRWRARKTRSGFAGKSDRVSGRATLP
jgi:hypothetical protein